MKRERKPESFIKKPEYPGGGAALKAFIQSNLQYPTEALNNKIEGVVRVRIDIDKKGHVVKTQLIDKLGYGCNEEAIRICKLLRFQVQPPKNARITFHKELNIPFRLPKAPSIQYSYTSESKNTEKDDSNEDHKGYTYTIKF